MLLSSANNLDAIKGSISRFYCGQEMTLVPDGRFARTWKLVRDCDGKELTGVFVTLHRNRYRFEMI